MSELRASSSSPTARACAHRVAAPFALREAHCISPHPRPLPSPPAMSNDLRAPLVDSGASSPSSASSYDGGATVGESPRLSLERSERRRALGLYPWLTTQVNVWIPACSLERAFDGASSTTGLPSIFPGKGPIPGVRAAWVAKTPSNPSGVQCVGATRICALLDKSEVSETYIQWSRPSAYAYEMTELKAPLSWMLKKATGTWEFTGVDGGVHIVWTYFGEWTNHLLWPLSKLLVSVFLRGAMNDCLERLNEQIQRENRDSAAGRGAPPDPLEQ